MKKLLWLLPAAAVFYLVYWYYQWQHWLSYATGSYDTKAGLAAGTPHHYNFFSGFGSDLGYVSIVASVLGSAALQWRSRTCHRYWWCWRHPHYKLEGTPFMLCHRHHPDGGLGPVHEAVAQYIEDRDATTAAN